VVSREVEPVQSLHVSRPGRVDGVDDFLGNLRVFALRIREKSRSESYLGFCGDDLPPELLGTLLTCGDRVDVPLGVDLPEGDDEPGAVRPLEVELGSCLEEPGLVRVKVEERNGDV